VRGVRHRAAGISPPIAHQITRIVPPYRSRGRVKGRTTNVSSGLARRGLRAACECVFERIRGPCGANTRHNACSIGQLISHDVGRQDFGEAEVFIEDIRLDAVLFRRRDPAMDEQLS
jgi:hypothetical protein